MIRACFALLIVAPVALAAPVPQGSLPVAPMPRAVNPDATLYLIEEVPDKEGSVTKRRLVQITVRNGKVWAPETLWEGDQRYFSHFGGHRIVRDRYLVTKHGGVIDLSNQKVISSEMHGNLHRVEGSLVYYWIANTLRDEGMFTFNLETHEIRRVAKIGEFSVGLPSPDGKKSVDASFTQLTLREGGKSTLLGKDFQVEMGLLASWVPHTPVIWIDNDRMLAQVKNGELVAVDLKGKRTEVVKIPVAKDLVHSPRFSRDPTGRIVYECGDEAFEVDVKAKQWARTEWTNLGHGFQISHKADAESKYTFRLHGRDIGRDTSEPIFYTMEPVARGMTTPGYLAISSSVNEGGRHLRCVRIWSEATREWTTIKVNLNSLVGWSK